MLVMLDMDTTLMPPTWQEAFKSQSIPTIKTLESRLRTDATRDKERLRILVGGNYRDLLNTADQIVELDKATRDANARIANLGSSCKPPEYDDSAKPLHKSTSAVFRLHTTTQLLQQVDIFCRRRDVLRAAQTFVMARLVLRSVEELSQHTKLEQTLTARLTQSRSTVITKMNFILSHPGSALKDLASAICAYCLISTCSPADAILHFRNLRLAKLADQGSTRPISRSRLLARCHYFVISAVALKGLHGRAVSDILNDLRRKPMLENILDDSSSLFYYYSLLPKDIQTFAPYIQKPSSSIDQVSENVAAWTREATQTLLTHVAAYLPSKQLADVLAARKDVLDAFLPSCFSASTYDHALPELEKAFSYHISNLIHTKCLQLIELENDKLLNTIGTESKLLWDTQQLQRQRTDSRRSLNRCRSHYLGTQEELERGLQRINLWSKHCRKIRRLLGELINIRWQDKIEDHDEEDENAANVLMAQLSRESPQRFVEAYDTALSKAISAFLTQVRAACAVLTNTNSEQKPSQNNLQITTWIRYLREIQLVLESMLPGVIGDGLVTEIQRLQAVLVANVMQLWRQQLSSSSQMMMDDFVIPDDLPTPRAIAALKGLCNLMTKYGGHDVWTKSAVKILKTGAQSCILDDDHRKLCIASDFDALYLGAAFATSDVSGNPDDREYSAVQRRAKLYWTRTKSLFGELDT